MLSSSRSQRSSSHSEAVYPHDHRYYNYYYTCLSPDATFAKLSIFIILKGIRERSNVGECKLHIIILTDLKKSAILVGL
jgi:hypothetical protein